MKKYCSLAMVVISALSFAQLTIGEKIDEANTKMMKNNLTTTSGANLYSLENFPVATLIPFHLKGKYGFKTPEGTIAIPPQYNNVCFFAEDCRLMNANNEDVKIFGSSDYASVQENGKDYRIDRKGKKVYQYNDADLGKCTNNYVKQKYLVYKYHNQFGLIEYEQYTEDEEKQLFKIHPQYEFIHVLEGKNIDAPLLIASKNNRFGVIDTNNQIIIPFEYVDIKRNYSWKLGHLFEVSKDGNRFYFINVNNKAYK
ncbi:MAG: WG repeat-containing protein [Bacteroidetes bacterium]|nr:WG repeat-containing protein [Bacteroidota bacterium]